MKNLMATAALVGLLMTGTAFDSASASDCGPGTVITTISLPAGVPPLQGPSNTIYPTYPSSGLITYAKINQASKAVNYNQAATKAWFIDTFGLAPPSTKRLRNTKAATPPHRSPFQ